MNNMHFCVISLLTRNILLNFEVRRAHYTYSNILPVTCILYYRESFSPHMPQHWGTCPKSLNFSNTGHVVKISVHYDFPQDLYPFLVLLQKSCTYGSPVQIDASSVRHITWYCCTSLRLIHVQTPWNESFRVGMSPL